MSYHFILLWFLFWSFYFYLYRHLKWTSRALSISVVVLFSSLLGARFFHILFEAPNYYLTHPLRSLWIWQGGFVLYGALFGMTIGLLILLRQKTWVFMNETAWLMALAVVVGRVGCAIEGCCFGKQSAVGAAYPVALWEASLVLLLAFYLYPKRDSENSILMLLGGYAGLRFILEFFRGDIERGFFFDRLISTSQMISLVILFGLFVSLAPYHFWKRATRIV